MLKIIYLYYNFNLQKIIFSKRSIVDPSLLLNNNTQHVCTFLLFNISFDCCFNSHANNVSLLVFFDIVLLYLA